MNPVQYEISADPKPEEVFVFSKDTLRETIELAIAKALSSPVETTENHRLNKMTVVQFAIAIQRCPEFVRRQIRLGKIPRIEAGGRPYLISPRALIRYDVTPAEALARLRAAQQERNQQPASLRCAV